VFVTDAACEFDPVKILEYLNRECPADSRAIPELASGDAALVCGCDLLHKRRMLPQSGRRKKPVFGYSYQ
jgi:hypothetical protein